MTISILAIAWFLIGFISFLLGEYLHMGVIARGSVIQGLLLSFTGPVMLIMVTIPYLNSKEFMDWLNKPIIKRNQK